MELFQRECKTPFHTYQIRPSGAELFPNSKFYALDSEYSFFCGMEPVNTVYLYIFLHYPRLNNRYLPDFQFLAHKSGKIATIGIGDGGNEIGMGKVHQRVIDHIGNGPQIASSVSTDQLITAGVSNWGGSALAAALFVLHQCPFHSRYVRRGIEQGAAVSFEEALNTVEKVTLVFCSEQSLRRGAHTSY